MSDSPANSLKPDPDAELVRLARQGSLEAFEQLVARHETAMYTLAMRMLRNPHDAQDVVQQTFLSVLENLEKFAGESQFRTWLVRIATNHALKLLRKKRGLPTTQEAPTTEDDSSQLPHPQFIAPWRENPGHVAQSRETMQLISDALDELDEKYRLAFILRDIEGLSVDETAQAMQISPANVKVRLLRARLMLRERLTQALGDPHRRITADHSHHQ